MRNIIHISDIHFKRIDMNCIGPMLEAFRSIKPDLIIISGDSTQRARVREFEELSKFIKSLEHPYLIIPGNHDIRPLYSPIARITNAYDRYKKYVSTDLEPTYVDNEIAVASVNTVRSSAIKDGRVSKKQIESLTKWFTHHSDDHVKIVVTHHPFDLPSDWAKRRLARKAKMAVHALAESGIDLYLSGHFHQSSIAHTAERYKIENYAAIAVQAGTISTRQRKEAQSFNLIRIKAPSIKIDTYLYNDRKKVFDFFSSKSFRQNKKEWIEDKTPRKV